MGKLFGVRKLTQIFQAHLHMTSGGIWQKHWLFCIYNDEVCMPLKDTSCNKAFSKLATTEGRENIHRNQTKENMSITHGQLVHKDRK